ncbi:hypothetical protein [Streptomyces sp. NPDC051554]|uniref:hypothetical protein n=1 Tax=Streptomyces sp. NPDC051554 TaxID=3365656 RepID=UPI0037A8F6E0
MTGFELRVSTQNSTFDDSGAGTLPVTVTNVGTEDASGETSVIVISPFYANFARNSEPAGFLRYIVENPAPNIPEMLECRIPAADLKAGSSVSLEVALALVEQGPRSPGNCMAIATPLFGNRPDLVSVGETAQIRKTDVSLPAPPAGANLVNAYTTFAKPVLKAGATRPLRLAVGNLGPKAPLSDAVVTLVTPHLSKVDRSNALFALLKPTYLHQLTDRPDVPDMVTLPVSRLLLPPDPNAVLDALGVKVLSVPLVGHGPLTSERLGKVMLAVGAKDFDPDKSIAAASVPAMQPA